MNEDEKIMWMFTKVHGVIGGACYTEIVYDDEIIPIAVDVKKDGHLCWTATKGDLVFDYICKYFS